MKKILCYQAYLKAYLILVCFFLFTPHTNASEEKTFGEVKKELLGKEVMITGIKASYSEDFVEWYPCRR